VGQWWQGGAIYQVYVRSFMDSDGDGVGDLAGITQRLDYLSWLGIDGIWLSPTMPSPNEDWGYDVSDYLGVDPALGTMGDLEDLIAEARPRGMAVLLDLVPNHTSREHPWFQAALRGPDDPHRDLYVWAPPGPGGGPPNNWLAAGGGPAWTLDPSSGQYYLHQFLPAQPDLNWWNPEVGERFDDILRWWFDRGVAGFRIDVAHGLVKDALLRDDPPASEDDHPMAGRHGLRRVYSANRPEVHDIYRRWRRIADSYDPARVLLGETWVFDPHQLAAFYGDGDELHLAFNFSFLFSDFNAPCLARVVRETMGALPEGACPVWTGSNHDVSRLVSRWCAGERSRAGAALVLLCTLPGTVVLYYGDEIGMADVDVPVAEARDRMGLGDPEGQPPRDRARTPMQWEAGPGCGFTSAPRPWLPVGDCLQVNVADQREDPGSLLSLTRRLLSLRRDGMIPTGGRYEEVAVGDRLWVYGVGEATVAVNLSDEGAPVELPDGPLLVSSSPGALEDGVLGPWGAVVVGRPS